MYCITNAMCYHRRSFSRLPMQALLAVAYCYYYYNLVTHWHLGFVVFITTYLKGVRFLLAFIGRFA
ncbi:hypothetical protein BpHYR1_003802 [Brachionus plicatilis]|uniref:Transmembrane protein n=1 Tax=Brachionus plicatilis TaxID=10195 RepID=A0A3M7RP37_BRAPC|nr:hypothetical protein BpHYR1_003802 [Brachionus plicatilis]